MARTARTVLHVMWAILTVTFGTAVGAATGWASHGWLGAVAVGFVGFSVGTLAATSPAAVLQFLHAGL
jgi:hypothetical protein